MPKNPLFESSNKTVWVLEYVAKYGADQHEERSIRLFDSYQDACDYVRYIVRDRLVRASYSTQNIVKVTRFD